MDDLVNDQIQAINKFIKASAKWRASASGSVRLTQDAGLDSIKEHRATNLPDFLGSSDFINQDFLSEGAKDFVERFQRANKHLAHKVKSQAKAFGDGLDSLESQMGTTSSGLRSHFSVMGDEIISNYVRNFKATMEVLNRESASADTLTIDPEFLEPMSKQMSASYASMMEMYATLKSIGESGEALNEYEEQMYNAVLMKMAKEERNLNKLKAELDESVSMAEDFGRTAEEKAQHMASNFNQRSSYVEALVNNLKRGDLIGVGRNASFLLKRNKNKGHAYNKAQKEVAKSMGKMGMLMTGLAALEIAIKSVKMFIGLLMGINDYTNEFNNKLFKNHGFLTQGIDVNLSVKNDTNLKEKYSKIHAMFAQFGAEGFNLLNEDQLLSITGAFEKEGRRFHQITSNEETFKSTIYTTLKAKYGLGLSLEESANLLAGWQHQLGLDIGQTSGLIDSLHGAVQDSGLPVGRFLESMQMLNSDYGITIDRFNTVLNVQRAGQKVGRLTAESNYKAVNQLLDHLRKMNPGNWAILVEPLLASGRMNELVHTEIDRLNTISENATDPLQKTQTALARDSLRESLKEQHMFQVRALQRFGSEETLLKVFQEGMTAHMGQGYKEQLKTGILTKDMEVTLLSIMGLPGDSTTIAMFTEAAYIVNEAPKDFALNPVQNHLKKANEQNKVDHAELGSEIAQAITATSTLTEMREALFRKWASQFMTALSITLKSLQDHWAIRLLTGGDPNKRKEIQDALNQAKDLVNRINAEEDEKKRAGYIAVLRQKMEFMKGMGSDMNAVIRELMSVPVSGDLMNLFEEFFVIPTSGGGANMADIDEHGHEGHEHRSGPLSKSEEELMKFVYPDMVRMGRGNLGKGIRHGGSHGYEARDVGVALGKPVHAAADGVVTVSSFQGAYGYSVQVTHKNGYSTWYAHHSKNLVKVGQKVSRGQKIALVGSTGSSSGLHGHFEIRLNGVPVKISQHLNAIQSSSNAATPARQNPTIKPPACATKHTHTANCKTVNNTVDVRVPGL